MAGPTFEGSERFRHTYAKLHVFNLTAYERVVFVDADAVVLRDVGALFLRSGASAGCRTTGINSQQLRTHSHHIRTSPPAPPPSSRGGLLLAFREDELLDAPG